MSIHAMNERQDKSAAAEIFDLKNENMELKAELRKEKERSTRMANIMRALTDCVDEMMKERNGG